MLSRMLTVAEVAEFLNTDADMVLQMIADGELLSFGELDSEDRLIPQSALHEYVAGAWTGDAWAS